ncbi:MAG: C39 family peptidase [Clostridium sp.]|nr:C39 family peptidase [Clostridium sp.]
MKVPFSYQKTEFDCGPTALTNALSFLFDREEIPPEMIRRIMTYCLDGFDEQGHPCRRGTSAAALRFIGSWINGYGEAVQFPIKTQFLEADQVQLGPGSPILKLLRQGGAAVIRVIYECGHYVLVTGIQDQDQLLVFDGYYEEGEDIDALMKEGIGIISGQPRRANRLVSISHMDSDGTGSYQLGPVARREAVLISRTDLQFHPL